MLYPSQRKGAVGLLTLWGLWVAYLPAMPRTLGIVGGEDSIQVAEGLSILCSHAAQRYGLNLRYEVFDQQGRLIRALKEGGIDIALVDGAWVARERRWIRPLLKAEINSADYSRLLLIVHTNSLFYKISELKGFELLLKQPHAELASYYAPLFFLRTRKVGVPKSSIRSLDTYESIVKSVAFGKGTEVGAIPEWVWRRNQGSRTLEFVRLLEELPPVPTPFLSIRMSDDPEKYRQFSAMFEHLASGEEGKKALSLLGVSGFSVVAEVEDLLNQLESILKEVDALYGPPE